MRHTNFSRRLTVRRGALLVTLSFLVTLVPTSVQAAEQNALFELRPHCTEYSTGDDLNNEWVLGPIPAPGIVVNTGDGENRVSCTEFEVLDPVTLKTKELRVGDILDIDLLVTNPDKLRISRVRAWLNYDPNILQGEFLEINENVFPEVTPNEKGFFPEEGYAKMEAGKSTKAPKDERIVFARLQFRVLKTTLSGSPITFHDVQPNGSSVIMTDEGGTEAYILKEEPGVLQVMFRSDNDGTYETDLDENDDNRVINEPEKDPDPNSCISNEDCESGLCISGECQKQQELVPNGGSCTFDAQCVSGRCSSGICVPDITEESDTDTARETQVPSQGTRRTAFSLLQVRNLRVTTEGTTAFLAWDHLQSSALKAYNVYYGTTSGRYIQRKTVDGSSNSLTLRSLPEGTEYYFAVRAISTIDEESAFSQEVSVVIGNPSTSTSPLSAGVITTFGPRGVNPVEGILDPQNTAVPGETGIPSAAALLLLISAVMGTILASRRQFYTQHSNPQL